MQTLAHVESNFLAQFGAALAMDGDTLVVGSPGQDSPYGRSRGAAFVNEYQNGTWVEVARLDPDVDTPGTAFGHAVALLGDVVVVGAPNDEVAPGLENAGAVYWFERGPGNIWTLGGRLTAPDAQAEARFGWTLAFDGLNLFVIAAGAERADPTARQSVTYAYHRTLNGWVAAGTPLPHDNPSTHRDHLSIAGVGDFLLIGVPGDEEKAQDAGAVHVYDFSTRVEVPSPLDQTEPPCGAVAGGSYVSFGFGTTFAQRFQSPDGTNARNHYSNQIAVSGDVMAVGERNADVTWGDPPQTYGVGAVHVYRRTGIDSWTLEETIEPPLDELEPILRVANFGFNQALDGPTLAVVAHNNSSLAKRVYIYERQRQGWVLQQRILRPPAGLINGQTFGREGLALSGNTLMVGENGFHNLSANPVIPTGAGAVWFFERDSNGAWILNAGPLPSSQAHFGQHLGFRVAVDGPAGRAVATGDRNDIGFRSAYLFERVDGIWQETTILNADSFGATLDFGQGGLDIEGDTLIVGDHFYIHPQNNRVNGGVFVWTHDGTVWNGPEVLVGSEPGPSGHDFGFDADLDGNLLVVGARHAYLEGGNTRTPRTGVLYVFGRENGVWTQRLRLPPGDPTIGWFGEHVAVSGGIIAAGTTLGSWNPNYQDAVFTFDLACSIPSYPGDLNGDGQRDLRDVAILQTNFGESANGPTQGDSNGDGFVDWVDWSVMVNHLGLPCLLP